MKANLALVHDTSAPPLTPDNLSDQGGEPRIRDIDLGERLGFENPLMIRKLIERNAGELRTYGPVSITVAETTAKGGRPGKVSWLNEGQCLVLCALSRTPRAAAVRKQVIDVFIAYRAGKLVAVSAGAAPLVTPEPAPGMVMVPADLLARIAGALDRIAAGRPALGSISRAERDAAELEILDGFLAAHVRQFPGGRVPAVEMYRTYAGWCQAEGRERLSDTKLARLLRHRLQRLDGSRPAYLDVTLPNPVRLSAPAAPSPKPAGDAPSATTDPGALLLGARAIGEYLGLSERQVKHNVATGALPAVFKMGRLLRSSKPALDAWIAESARAGVAR